jgi:hypothetical protein
VVQPTPCVFDTPVCTPRSGDTPPPAPDTPDKSCGLWCAPRCFYSISPSDVGKGELTFHFRNPGTFLFDRQFGEVGVNSNDPPLILPTDGAAIQYRLINSVALSLAVEGVDNDIDFFEACRTDQPPDGTSGSDNCFDWATAKTSISIAQFSGLSQNFTQKPLVFQTTAYRLKFKVFATVTVGYGEKIVL